MRLNKQIYKDKRSYLVLSSSRDFSSNPTTQKYRANKDAAYTITVLGYYHTCFSSQSEIILFHPGMRFHLGSIQSHMSSHMKIISTRAFSVAVSRYWCAGSVMLVVHPTESKVLRVEICFNVNHLRVSLKYIHNNNNKHLRLNILNFFFILRLELFLNYSYIG